MRFTSLASSSRGNAYIVSDKGTRILLECGLSRKKLQKLAGFSLTGLDGCLVSHEHKDHSGCVSDIVSGGIPVYMSAGTAEALGLDTVEPVGHGEQFRVGSLDILPFNTFHDAKEPLGFLIQSREDGESLVFATDTVNLGYRFPGVTYFALEANYDKEILARCERMPEKVKGRIERSHMEIGTLCQYLGAQDCSRVKAVYLLHLSDATSHEGHFINKVRRVLPAAVEVTACGKEGGGNG